MTILAIVVIVVLLMLGFETREINLDWLHRTSVESVKDDLDNLNEENTIVDTEEEPPLIGQDESFFLNELVPILEASFDQQNLFTSHAQFNENVLTITLTPLGNIRDGVNAIMSGTHVSNSDEVRDYQVAWDESIEAFVQMSRQIYYDFGYANYIFIEDTSNTYSYLVIIYDGQLYVDNLFRQ